MKPFWCLMLAVCLWGHTAPAAHAHAPWSALLRESREGPERTGPAHVQQCLSRAARHFAVPPLLLQAIAEVESGGDPRAVNRSNRNGSHDVGLMQINSSWLPRLARWNIQEADLFDACISAHVGAWILADNLNRLGPVWRAVGAYNARSPHLQVRYVKRVQRWLATLAQNERVISRQSDGVSHNDSSSIKTVPSEPVGRQRRPTRAPP